MSKRESRCKRGIRGVITPQKNNPVFCHGVVLFESTFKRLRTCCSWSGLPGSRTP